MERGTIPLDEVGPFDLHATLESGQSYLWWREDGPPHGATDVADGLWYYTTTRATGEDRQTPAVIRIRQHPDALEWESHVDADQILRQRLGLTDDLDMIRTRAPDDDIVQQAFDEYWGMRIVRDPPFETLVSFICSAQMRVGRIHEMQQSLRESLGPAVTFEGTTCYGYPTPEQITAVSEADLRALSLGYRAPYVRETAAMVEDGTRPGAIRGQPYETARSSMTRYVGVGEKVADCVLLFSLGYHEAVPLDTWMRRTIGEFYPDCDRDGYAATSRALRKRLGGDIAGYTQTYLFHYLRMRDG